jgi:hypothetical protein
LEINGEEGGDDAHIQKPAPLGGGVSTEQQTAERKEGRKEGRKRGTKRRKNEPPMKTKNKRGENTDDRKQIERQEREEWRKKRKRRMDLSHRSLCGAISKIIETIKAMIAPIKEFRRAL